MPRPHSDRYLLAEQRRRDDEVAAIRRPLGYGSGFSYDERPRVAPPSFEEKYSPRVAPPTTHSRIFPDASSPRVTTPVPPRLFPPTYNPGTYAPVTTTAILPPRLWADRADMQSTAPQLQPRYGGSIGTPRIDTYTNLTYGTNRGYGTAAAPRANSAAPGQRPPTAIVTRPTWH